MFKAKRNLRLTSLFTALFFLASTFGAYAQAPVTTTSQVPSVTIPAALAAHPEVQVLTSNLQNVEHQLRQIEQVSIPLYNKIAPSNMEAMSISQRIKAILGNTKDLVKTGLNSYKGKVNDYNQAKGITPDTSFEAELGIGLNELGAQSGQLPLDGKGNVAVSKLKQIIEAIKTRMGDIIRVIRAKIASVAVKVGLMKQEDAAKFQKGKDSKGVSKETEGYIAPEAGAPQMADTFSAKLSKGVADGAQNAKASLKSSFSFTNLALTTGVSVGTNLALQYINGKKPSLGDAARSVATVEFAGSVVGSALGAAGGQFLGTVVKSIMPGPIGALVGTFVPVLTGSFGAQVGSGVAGSLKERTFSLNLGQTLKNIDYVDLVGSSLGSTIGMMLGAPIPIIGPLVGGIVGGIVGSKIAKFAKEFFLRGSVSLRSGKTIVPENPGRGISIGNGGQNLGLNGPVTWPGNMAPVNSQEVQVSGELGTVERKYYETYLDYNRLVEQGKTEEAKKKFEEVKMYSDQYNALKKAK